ncbi:hypothetical protein [Bradyrhizobium sp. AZCC 2289]|uniref:hypothetical protein n=1 Tax=Bradyrhizobium sp. AZCC 2289 TaxID=3117026 RepID=UPI002FF05C42
MTSGNELISWGAAIAGDVMSKLMIPGGNSLSKLGDAYLQKKRKEAADILIGEIAKGSTEPIDFTESDADPLIEIIYRFSKAVSDGAARENLRLLAQVIVGLKKNKALDPDKFRKWANTLEQLTRDELMVIGKAIATKREIDAGSLQLNVPGEFSKHLRSALERSGYQPAEIEPLCASLSRTGLLLPVSAYNGMIYMPTLWLDELATLADVEGIAATK